MANQTACSRRVALRGTVALIVLAGCSKKDDKAKELACTDTSGLAPADVEMRTTTLAYVDKSPDPAKQCQNCQQYKAAPAPGTCGGCTIVKGPIHPLGYCKSWVQKTT